MLSVYDSLAFAMHKRSFCMGFLFLLFVLTSLFVFSFIFSTCCDVSAFDFIQSGLPVVQKPLKAAATFYHHPEVFFVFKSTGVILILASFLIVSCVFCFYLISAKRLLLNQSMKISFKIFIANVCQLLVVLLPVLLLLFYFLGTQSKWIVLGKDYQIPGWLSKIPFLKNPVVFLSILAAIFYLYFASVVSLFAMHFRIGNLSRVKTLARHGMAFGELILKISFVVASTVALYVGLYFMVKAFDYPSVGFFFLIFYFSLLLFFKGIIHFWILAPFLIDFAIMINYLISGRGMGYVQGIFWTMTLLLVLIFVVFYIFSMMWAAVAHLMAQASYVYVFSQSAVQDALKAQPEKKKEGFKPVYQQFAEELKEKKDECSEQNYFNRQTDEQIEALCQNSPDMNIPEDSQKGEN